MPVFADALNWTGRETLQQEATRVCGPNEICMFDAWITGDTKAASSTANVSQVFNSVQTVRGMFKVIYASLAQETFL